MFDFDVNFRCKAKEIKCLERYYSLELFWMEKE